MKEILFGILGVALILMIISQSSPPLGEIRYEVVASSPGFEVKYYYPSGFAGQSSIAEKIPHALLHLQGGSIAQKFDSKPERQGGQKG